MRRVRAALARGRGTGARRRLRMPTGREALIGILLFALLAGSVAGLLRFRVDTSIESFLPAGDPAVAKLEAKARSFGGDPVVAIVESEKPRDLLTDPAQLKKLLRLEGNLAKTPDVAAVYGPATVLNQTAIAAQNILARISGKRDALRAQAEQRAREQGLSGSAAKKSGDRAVAAFEQRYGSLLVRGLPAGLPTLRNPKFVQNVIYGEDGTPRPQWHFVVPSENSVAVLIRPRENIDQADTQAMVSAVRAAVNDAGLQTSRTTVTGIPAVTAGIADQVADELPLLGALVLLAMFVRFLFVPTRTGWVRRLWPLAAALIGSGLTLAAFGWLGLSMSFGAVALLPLLLGIGSSFPLYLSMLADRRLVLVVSIASAAAFGSLAISPLPFVRELGVALAAGVLMTVAVALVVGRKRRPPTEPPATSEQSRAASSARTVGARRWPVATRWAVLGLIVLLAGAGWASLPGTRVQADPRELGQGLPELENAQYAERVLGSSGEVSVVLSGPDVLSPTALDWARNTENKLIAEHGDEVRPVLTLPDLLRFLGDSPSSAEIAAGVQLLPSYLTGAVAKPDGQQAVMTFGLKIQDLGRQSRLLGELRDSLPKPPAGLDVQIVGLPVAADRGYVLLSNDRYLSNILGIVAAGVVLALGLRRRIDALRGVLAAALATGWSLAAVWLLGASLSPLTIALGSLTTVTACEFTVLLAHATRERHAWLRRAIGWACITSAVGYLVLVPSSLWLLREFGLVLTGTVLFSYLAARAIVRLLPPGSDSSSEPDQAQSSISARKEIPA